MYPKLFEKTASDYVFANTADDEKQFREQGYRAHGEAEPLPTKSAAVAEATDQPATEQSESQSSSAESVAPITIVEMTKAQLIEALRALGQTANATMSKDALIEKFQKAQEEAQ